MPPGHRLRHPAGAGPPLHHRFARTRVPGTCGLRAVAGPDLRPGLARPRTPPFKYRDPLVCRAGSTGGSAACAPTASTGTRSTPRPGARRPPSRRRSPRWVAEPHTLDPALVDLGAGTLRDSRFFVRKGRSEVLAVDWQRQRDAPGPQARQAWLHREAGEPQRHPAPDVPRCPSEPHGRAGRPLRPLPAQHLGTPAGSPASSGWRRCRCAGRAALPGVRTPRDRAGRGVPGQKRVFLDPDEVSRRRARAGRVVHRGGDGSRAVQDEDPHVCRIVAMWGADPDGGTRGKGPGQGSGSS